MFAWTQGEPQSCSWPPACPGPSSTPAPFFDVLWLVHDAWSGDLMAAHSPTKLTSWRETVGWVRQSTTKKNTDDSFSLFLSFFLSLYVNIHIFCPPSGSRIRRIYSETDGTARRFSDDDGNQGRCPSSTRQNLNEKCCFCQEAGSWTRKTNEFMETNCRNTILLPSLVRSLPVLTRIWRKTKVIQKHTKWRAYLYT